MRIERESTKARSAAYRAATDFREARKAREEAMTPDERKDEWLKELEAYRAKEERKGILTSIPACRKK
jgi:hypothetical protein